MKIECQVVKTGDLGRYQWRVVYVNKAPSVVLWSHAHYLTHESARAAANKFIARVAGFGLALENKSTPRCLDCGAVYADFPLDTTLPDEQWRMIHGSEGGLLCASCIVKRASCLPGAIAIRARIDFADDAAGRETKPCARNNQ